MRNKNNTDANKRKTETAADIEFAVMIVLLALAAFAAGFYTASARIAALIASN
jgi:hypothetical protein